MSKKKNNKRLENLFNDLATAEPKPAKEKTPETLISGPVVAPPWPRSAAPSKPTLARTEEKTAAIPPAALGDPGAMSLAFRTDEKNWATLRVVDETEPRTWAMEEQMLVKQVADQLSLALENARLFQEAQQRAAELSILNELGRELTSLLEVSEIAETVYRHTTRLMDTTNFFIALLSENEQMFSFPVLIDEGKRVQVPERQIARGLSAYVIRTKQPLFIPDNVVGKIKELGLDPLTIGGDAPALCWLGVPLLAGPKVTGVLTIQSTKKSNLFTERQRDLLLTIAGQAAIALENARLFQETQQRNEELATLNEVIGSASQTLELKTIFHTVLTKTLETIGFDGGLITMFNPSRGKLERIVRIGLPGEIPPDPAEGMENSLCAVVFNSRDALAINDFRQGAPVDVSGEIEAGFLSYLGAPLESKGQVLGTICVFRKSTGTIGQPTIDLMRTVGRQVGFTIENAQLFDETQRRAREMSALAEVGQDVSASLDLQVVLERIAAHAKELLGALSSAVYVPEADGITFRAIAVLGTEADEIRRDAIRTGEGILGHVAKIGRGEIVNNAIQDQRALLISGTEQLQNEHLMATPLLSGTRVSGIMAVWRTGAGLEFNESDLDLLTGLARQAAIAVENARLFEATRESQQAVARSEGELRALFTAMTDVILILDKDGRYLRIAPTNPSRLVKPADELLGQLTDDVLPSEAAHAINDAIKQALRTGETVKLEYKLEINQQEYWFDAAASKLNEDQVFLVARDTTDRKYNELLQTAIAQIAEAALSAEDMAGLTKIIHENVNTLMPARNFYISLYDERADLMTFPYHADEYDTPFFSQKPGRGLIGYVLRTGRPLLATPEVYDSLEKAGEVKAEGMRGVDWLGVPLRSGAQPIGVMAVQTFDPKIRLRQKDLETLNLIAAQAAIAIERKRAEEVLKRRNEYLAAAAEIGRLVTSTLDLNTIFSRTVNLVSERFGYYHAAIFVVEETGFNAVLVEATGEGGQEMKRRGHSQPINNYSIIGRAIQIGAPVVVNNTALDGTHKLNPFLPFTRAEAVIPLRVGTRVIGVLDIQSPTIDAFREDDMAVLQILTDQVAVAIDNARSYELSQQAVKEMREVDRMKSMFLANMSHELRTPLNSIIGFSRVILKGIDGPVSELQQQDLTAIYNSGQHLLGLINDILDLSKIEAGKMELAFDEVNMADVINSVMSTVVGLIKDKPVKLVRNIQGDLPTVRADAIRVRQVLLNLLSNAAKFTSEGSITVDAEVATGPAGHPEILVSVTDTGPGIEPKDQAKLFQPFSQVDDSLTRRTGGTGLGLSISQQLIQMHGGRIGLNSTVGKGSTFYFTLPIYRGKEETSLSNDGKVILAIDDDPQVISLYERYLQPQGYQVVALTNPSQAMERAKQLHPYAITLDIMMPGYDGWSVLSDLKSDAETRDVPVIVCSIVEDQERGFSLGAADYLLKPILEDDLLNALDHLNRDGSIREVLVVDDNPSDLRLMDKILQEHGRYKAILAESGRKGWDIILSHPPHAVVLDLFMPEMDGFTILEKMRENPKLRDIPVVVVSGVDLSAEQQQQLKEFGQRLLNKGSLNESDLLNTIERALQRVEGRK
ncbi:MAG TPA: GAF domain-containing protein [Anaerolineales bacterium]|nr:GAF domain-containing protein [Anaerolineales bacterium]